MSILYLYLTLVFRPLFQYNQNQELFPQKGGTEIMMTSERQTNQTSNSVPSLSVTAVGKQGQWWPRDVCGALDWGIGGGAFMSCCDIMLNIQRANIWTIHYAVRRWTHWRYGITICGPWISLPIATNRSQPLRPLTTNKYSCHTIER